MESELYVSILQVLSNFPLRDTLTQFLLSFSFLYSQNKDLLTWVYCKHYSQVTTIKQNVLGGRKPSS